MTIDLQVCSWWGKFRAAMTALRTRVAALAVDDIRHLHRFYTTWAAAVGATLTTVWVNLPGDIRAMLPGWLVQVTAYAVLLAVVLGAAAKQEFPKNRDTPEGGA